MRRSRQTRPGWGGRPDWEGRPGWDGPAGSGCPGLAERVGALGGSLRAGQDGAGWRLVARLPLGAS
ncbi:hypothetical protein [Jiangella alkaliphila]|uniref:hypothetical protein n=1 Tax=Jiangella alkaliphila TaxID=419479 RepID=UPI00128C3338|nr:hypothetical protein [Jiangella alkaliphila]